MKKRGTCACCMLMVDIGKKWSTLSRVDILQNVIPLVRSKMLYLKFYWHLLCFWLFQFREDVEDVVFRAKHFSRPSIWPWHGKLTWHGKLKMTWQAVIFQWQAVIFQLLPFFNDVGGWLHACGLSLLFLRPEYNIVYILYLITVYLYNSWSTM